MTRTGRWPRPSYSAGPPTPASHVPSPSSFEPPDSARPGPARNRPARTTGPGPAGGCGQGTFPGPNRCEIAAISSSARTPNRTKYESVGSHGRDSDRHGPGGSASAVRTASAARHGALHRIRICARARAVPISGLQVPPSPDISKIVGHRAAVWPKAFRVAPNRAATEKATEAGISRKFYANIHWSQRRAHSLRCAESRGAPAQAFEVLRKRVPLV